MQFHEKKLIYLISRVFCLDFFKFSGPLWHIWLQIWLGNKEASQGSSWWSDPLGGLAIIKSVWPLFFTAVACLDPTVIGRFWRYVRVAYLRLGRWDCLYIYMRTEAKLFSKSLGVHILAVSIFSICTFKKIIMMIVIIGHAYSIFKRCLIFKLFYFFYINCTYVKIFQVRFLTILCLVNLNTDFILAILRSRGQFHS